MTNRKSVKEIETFELIVKKIQALGYSEKIAIKRAKCLLKYHTDSYSRKCKRDKENLADYGY